MTTALNYNSSCIHFGGHSVWWDCHTRCGRDFFLSASSLEVTHFELVFSAPGSCWTFERRVSAVVRTARNAHLDCVRTSLNPLQIPRQLLSRPWCKVKDSIVLILSITYCHVHPFSEMAGVPCRDSLSLLFTEFVFFLGFPTIQLYFSRKRCAEYAPGVSGARYACNQSYRRCIYSMCCVLYTCVGMHMLTGPRDYAAAVKMCDHSIL